ncbi:MAG: hypothetical protein O3A46_00705 [Candidatus Poribacteria bacterium]|nr:hypothetical protein [Candidatus Poribacteria bacterium]
MATNDHFARYGLPRVFMLNDAALLNAPEDARAVLSDPLKRLRHLLELELSADAVESGNVPSQLSFIVEQAADVRRELQDSLARDDRTDLLQQLNKMRELASAAQDVTWESVRETATALDALSDASQRRPYLETLRDAYRELVHIDALVEKINRALH